MKTIVMAHRASAATRNPSSRYWPGFGAAYAKRKRKYETRDSAAAAAVWVILFRQLDQ